MRVVYGIGLLMIGLASPCLAAKQNISPQLREQAVQLCTGDAMRLCFASLMDEERTTQCMSANRTQLSSPCRAVFDQGKRPHRR